jgi:hypothetical protein
MTTVSEAVFLLDGEDAPFVTIACLDTVGFTLLRLASRPFDREYFDPRQRAQSPDRSSGAATAGRNLR